MNFLFFDIECAVCNHIEKRICSFGYVLTDSNLNIIKKEDILINPLVFDNKILDNVIDYKKADLSKEKEFPFYYEYIKSLLEDKNNIVIAQVAKNDASYLIDTLKRYKLDSINFVFYDFAEIYKNYINAKQYVSLENERIFLGISDKQGTLHTSLNDAYILYECFKALYLRTNLTKSALIKKYKGIKGFVKNNELYLFEDFRNLCNTMSDHSTNKEYFKQYLNNIKNIKPENNLFENKNINISKDYAKNHFKEMLYIAYLIRINNGLYSILNFSDIYVSTGENTDVINDYPNIKIIELNDFLDEIKFNKNLVNNHFDRVLKNDMFINKNFRKEKKRIIEQEFKRLRKLEA